jgi:AcrR family transcriptional regulator
MSSVTGERSASTRLSADDWLRAALDLMAEDGIRGVKIQRLCDRLGVTKGSFYWHFADLDAFLDELARRWGEDSTDLPHAEDGDPNANLLLAMRLFADKRNRDLTRAVRDWAQHDERARAAIRRADQRLFRLVRQALLDTGLEAAEAEIRAKILIYAGVGLAHVGPLGGRSSGEAELRKTWEILNRPG